MNDAHEPTPEFLAHMERETLYALRRPVPRAPAPLLRHLRTAALVVLALGVGAGCVVVAERVQDSRRIERELARNGIRVELAERRYEALRSRTETARLRHAEGVASVSEVAEAERRLLGAERALQHVRLEREELDAGGGTFPRTAAADGGLQLDLTAPLVAGRDFVSEHLRVERQSWAAELEQARAELERALALHGAGRVSGSEPARARAALAELEIQVVTLERRLAARAEFLQGRTTREACERADLLLASQARRSAGAARISLLREELARAEQLASAGVAPAPQDLRLDLEEAESELALVELELETLR